MVVTSNPPTTSTREAFHALRPSCYKVKHRTFITGVDMPMVRQRILAAYLTRPELLAQAQLLSEAGDAAQKAELWNQYKIARSRLHGLQPIPSTPPTIDSLPSESRGHIRDLEGTDSFQESFGGTDYEFLSVPIERITPIQIFCNLEPDMPAPNGDDLRALLEYALPKDAVVPGETTITPTGIRFSSPRYGLGQQNVRRRLRGSAVVVTFEHANLVQVHRYPNLLLLLNGTHRCLEIHRAGRSHIPALVINHQSPAEFEGPAGPGFWSQQFLFANPRQPFHGARPPLIPDFESDLSVECRVATTPSVVEVSFGSPAASPPPIAPLMGQPIAIQFGGMGPPRVQ
jgi:hypothetical protein